MDKVKCVAEMILAAQDGTHKQSKAMNMCFGKLSLQMRSHRGA